MTEELLPCPFCCSGEYRIEEKRLHSGVYMNGDLPEVVVGEITHWCKKIDGQPQSIISFKGRTKDDVISIWNTRAAPKMKRVDLSLKREMRNPVKQGGKSNDWYQNGYDVGYNAAIDDIKSKYGDLYVEVK